MHHSCDGANVVYDELSEIVVRNKPLLILLVLPRARLKFPDALFRVLKSAASAARMVVVVESDQEDLIELVRRNVDDFIMAPLRDSEVLLRVRRLLNQSCQEQNTRQFLTEKLGLQQLIGQHPLFVSECDSLSESTDGQTFRPGQLWGHSR
jgi:DNA-binding response OmpR family regulator